jgi:hypothetical protein
MGLPCCWVSDFSQPKKGNQSAGMKCFFENDAGYLAYYLSHGGNDAAATGGNNEGSTGGVNGGSNGAAAEGNHGESNSRYVRCATLQNRMLSGNSISCNQQSSFKRSISSFMGTKLTFGLMQW